MTAFLPHLAYVVPSLDRASERRADAAFIEAAARRPDARALIVGGELVLLRPNSGEMGDPLFAIADAARLEPAGEPVFLGLQGEAPRLAYSVTPEAAERLRQAGELLAADLRTIALRGLVAPEHLQTIATAKAVLSWHARHRFCANCGASTRSAEAGWRRDCPSCGAQHFPRTDPCVIMLAIDGERCLLGRQSRFPPGMWSCLAGFVEPGETIEGAVRRETREEAGIAVGRVVYLASQPWPFPMSLMIGCFAEATSGALTIDRNEIEDARWVARTEAALMLERRHPDGLFTPPPFAVAHHIIRAFADHGAGVLRWGAP